MDQIPPLPPVNYYGQPPGGNLPAGLAIASMVCGIASLPLICLWFLSFTLAVVAVVLGLVAKARVRRGVAGGGGMATAGLVCGGITLAVFAVFVVVAVLAVVTAGLSDGHR